MAIDYIIIILLLSFRETRHNFRRFILLIYIQVFT